MKGDIIHFEIPADDPAKLAAFYTKVLGWKIENPDPNMGDYQIIHSSSEEKTGGGLYKKTMPQQTPVNYYEVDSIEAACDVIREAGGQVAMEKMPVPGMGYFAIGIDPEGNPFGVWVTDTSASVPQ